MDRTSLVVRECRENRILSVFRRRIAGKNVHRSCSATLLDSTQANKLFSRIFVVATAVQSEIIFVFRTFLYDNSIRNDISELASGELSIRDSCYTNRFYDFN